MLGENIQHLLTIFFSAASGNRHAEHDLLAFIVDSVVIEERRAADR